MPSSPGSVGLARAHPLTKTQAMASSRQTWSSYGPPYPLGRWSALSALLSLVSAVVGPSPRRPTTVTTVVCPRKGAPTELSPVTPPWLFLACSVNIIADTSTAAVGGTVAAVGGAALVVMMRLFVAAARSVVAFSCCCYLSLHTVNILNCVKRLATLVLNFILLKSVCSVYSSTYL